MGWPFCDRCGTILEPPGGDSDSVQCPHCHLMCEFSALKHDAIVTTLPSRAQADWAKEDSVVDEDAAGASNRHATIEEPCPKCGHPEMYFYTMQLRSVDEGQTVFYECISCSHKYSVNN